MADYSSLDEVAPFVLYILDGETTFNSTTRPTATQVETFLTYTDAELNDALHKYGFTPPMNSTSNSTAQVDCSMWASFKVAQMVEQTQRGVGYNDSEGNRWFRAHGIPANAERFVKLKMLAWQRGGATMGHKLSEGLQFTGMPAQADRADPDDTSITQPKVVLGQWDNS